MICSSLCCKLNQNIEFIPSHPVVQEHDQPANVALANVGMLGCSPLQPTIAITFECLQLYYRLRLRQSSFSTQAMARVFCALHNVHSILI